MSELDQRVKRQKAEFDTLHELLIAYQNLPPIVDDSYPFFRSRYESVMHTFLQAVIKNRPEMLTGGLTINRVLNVSVERAKKWHGEKGLDDWSILEWAGAMTGEAGEAANVAKKLRREDSGINSPLSKETREHLRKKLASELADVFLYLVLMAAKENIDFEGAIIETFNKKSIEYNFPERL